MTDARPLIKLHQTLLALLSSLLVYGFASVPVYAQGVAAPLEFDAESFLNNRVDADSERTTDFTWVRGRYTNYSGGVRGRRGGGGGFGGGGGRSGWWDTDYPDAESNFLRGVQRYTNIDANSKSYDFMDLTDPRLFEHSFLYMNMKRVPIGSLYTGPDFQPDEIVALREFMLRGGFVLLDDFWGDAHLQDFQTEMTKLFPERELVKLDTRHELFHTFFDINEVAQVPGRAVTWDYNSGFSLDDPNYPPSVYAILDDDGRVMLVANHNADLGDGWEHTFYEPYPTRYSNEAYKIAINFLIYAFTH